MVAPETSFQEKVGMYDGDLWEHTQKMVEAKGPKSVSYRKVKGHATEEVVASGKVTREDKEGNDEADSAADRGSNNEQSSLYTLTKMLAARHEEYKLFMARVQKFLVATKKAETATWEEKERWEAPFQTLAGKRKSRKVKVATALGYPRGQATTATDDDSRGTATTLKNDGVVAAPEHASLDASGTATILKMTGCLPNQLARQEEKRCKLKG